MDLISHIKIGLLLMFIGASTHALPEAQFAFGDFSTSFTWINEKILDYYNLINKRMVRDKSVKPSIETIEWTQISRCWFGCKEEYYLVDYHLNGDKSNPVIKVFVAKTQEVGEIPDEFNSSGYNRQLHFGLLIFEESKEDVLYFVIHPNSWGPFQHRFRTKQIVKDFKAILNGGVGAMVGAAIGSVIPGAGTAIGAVLGAVSSTAISRVIQKVFGAYLLYIG